MSDRVKSQRRRQIEQWFIRGLGWVAGGLVRVLPLRALQHIGNGIGLILMALTPSRQKLADRNLRRVFGDRYDARQRRWIRRFVAQGFCKGTLELIKLYYLSDEQVCRVVRGEGLEHLRDAVAQGKGAIVLAAHYGNDELANPYLAIQGLPLCMVSRPAPSASVEAMFRRSRERHGGSIVNRNDVRGMLKVLREGRILGILPDQHAKVGGILGTFLGLSASNAPGTAVIATRTGAPIIPVFASRQPDDTFICRCYPPLELHDTGDRDADMATNTQIIMDAIGDRIREAPEQWLWLHDRWRPHDAGK